MNSPRIGPEPSRTPHACSPSRHGLSENRTRVGAGSHARPRHGRSEDKTLPETAAPAANPSVRSSLRRPSPIQPLAAAPVRRSALLIVLPARPDCTAVQPRVRPPTARSRLPRGVRPGKPRTAWIPWEPVNRRTPSRRKRPSTRGRAVANAPPDNVAAEPGTAVIARGRPRRSTRLVHRDQEPTRPHHAGSKSPLGGPRPGARAHSAPPRREQKPTRRKPGGVRW